MTDPKKKDEFKVWPDSKQEDMPIVLKSSEEVTQVLETMKAVDEMSAEEKLIKHYPYLGEVLKDKSLSPFQKKLKMMPVYKGIREEHEQIMKEKGKLDDKVAFLKTLEPAADAYTAWKDLTPRLEKNDCSRLHNLVAHLKKQFRFMPEIVKGGNPSDYPWHEVVPFVVQHDWVAAFKNATDYDGSFNLPYSRCAFEFRISGYSFIALVGQDDKEHEPNYRFYVSCHDYWLSEDDDKEQPPAWAFAREQIKAICIALDAEVATHNVQRASEKVNRRRELEGKEPFFSYHIVNLNRRVRVANPSNGGSATSKRRLHFRRGHWRHYEKFKTWIRWCLAGDPDLGFIDKEYRL